jgi:hypothetical protein
VKFWPLGNQKKGAPDEGLKGLFGEFFWPKSSYFEVESSQVAIFRHWLESF